MSDILIGELEYLGYSCSTILNDGDTIDNCVFISRKNASAHGDFSRITIVEQMHGYKLDDDLNTLFKLYTNRETCLDQYTKASEFTKSVVERFNTIYPNVKVHKS